MKPIIISLLYVFAFNISQGTAQGQGADKNDLFRVSYNLAKNPAGNFEGVSGIGVHLSISKTYFVSIRYVEGKDSMVSGARLIIYKDISPKNKKEDFCSQNECWQKLVQFTRRSQDTTYTIQSQDKILLASWNVNAALTRGGSQSQPSALNFEKNSANLKDANKIQLVFGDEYYGQIIVNIRII